MKETMLAWKAALVVFFTALGELLDSCGVVRLENRYLPVSRDGAQIIVAGAEDPDGRADMIKPDALAEMLREEYPEEFVLWLGHRNYWAEKYPSLPVDLILSGHCHGGQIRVCGRGIFAPGQGLLPKYHHGVYDGRLVVSAGCANTASFPRWGNETEVVIVRLESETVRSP